MKTRTLTLLAAVFAILFLFSCAAMPALPSATTVVKKAVKKAFLEPTMEVLEIKLEKTTDELTVTGMAIYHPADVDGKEFNDYMWDVKVEFYDAQGKKLPYSMKSLEYGEYNKSANVLPNEPFPFMGEIGSAYMGEDVFTKAVSCKLVYVKAY
ncbi:MAG: hypothetical protein KAU44_07275 [Candidatus Marinimicrobia bacterium]|nr:hypothetical protein [Candidatus Neomarinimicrobiota bacterium]